MVRRWAFWEDQSKTESGPNNGPQSAGPGRIKHVMTGRTCACFWMGNRGITLFHADVKAGCPCCGLLWRFAWSLCVSVWQVKWLFMTSSLHSVTFGSRQQLMSAFVPVFVCAGTDGAKCLWDEEVCSASIKEAWNTTLVAEWSDKKAKKSKTRVPQELPAACLLNTGWYLTLSRGDVGLHVCAQILCNALTRRS